MGLASRDPVTPVSDIRIGIGRPRDPDPAIQGGGESRSPEVKKGVWDPHIGMAGGSIHTGHDITREEAEAHPSRDPSSMAWGRERSGTWSFRGPERRFRDAMGPVGFLFLFREASRGKENLTLGPCALHPARPGVPCMGSKKAKQW